MEHIVIATLILLYQISTIEITTANCYEGDCVGDLWKLLKEEYSDDYLFQCNKIHTCSQRRFHGSILHNKTCSCDRTCTYFRDCCYEFADAPSEKSNYSEYEYVDCVILDHKDGTAVGKPYSFVSKCPNTWKNNIIRQKCNKYDKYDTIYYKIPVSNIRTNVTFRNIYCAMCHNLPKEDALVWGFEIACESFSKPRGTELPTLLRSYMDDVKCNYSFLSKGNTDVLRPCIPDSPIYIDSCSSDYIGPLRDICTKYFGLLVLIRNGLVYKLYRNVHCLQCDTSPISAAVATEFKIECNSRFDRKYVWYGFITALDFSNLLWPEELPSLDGSCKDNEIYIKEINGCKDLHCPEKLIPYQGDCVSYSSSSMTCILNLVFYINGSLDVETARNAVLQIIQSTEKIRCEKLFTRKVLNGVQIEYGVNVLSNETCMYAFISLEMFSFLRISRNLKACIKKTGHILSANVNDKVFIKYVNNIDSSICRTPKVINIPEIVLFPDSTTLHTDELTCPSLEVKANLLPFNTTEEHSYNSSLLFSIDDNYIDSTKVKKVKHKYFVCLVDFKLYSKENYTFKTSDILSLSDKLSLACLSVSVFSLFITLLHYCVIPKLITSQNFVLFHLMFITCVSQSTYLSKSAAITHTKLCWWFGVFLHFLFLVMFFTMCLCLCQIALSLRKLQAPLQRSIVSVFVVFVLPGYICALAVVSVTISLNLIVFPSESWYGGDVCYITNPKVILFAFAIPVACCIIVSVSIFGSVVRYLFSVSSDKIIHTNRNYFLVVIKLSTLTGVTWVLGFIAVITRIKAFVYVFEIFSSLQGLFLSISLLSNQVVKRQYSQKFPCCNQMLNNERGTVSANPN